MPEVTETRLPGVGVRHDFTTAGGERLAVLTLRGGDRELAVYARDDPDTCTASIRLGPDDARTLAELLGASQVSEAAAVVQQQIEGLAIEWLTVPPSSPLVGATIGEGELRTRTGTSIVAVVRGTSTIPAPGPEHRFDAGEVLVAVGTPAGLAELRHLLGV